MASLTQKVVEIFSKTPEFQAAEAEAKQAVEQERQADVDRLGQIEGEVIKAVVEPMKAKKKAADGVLKARETLLAKERIWGTAAMEEQNIRAVALRECAVIEQRLTADAIPGLREFISDATDRWNRERHRWNSGLAPDNEDVAQALANELRKSVPDFDNVELLRGRLKMPARVRMEQIRDITARAEALYLEPNAEKATAELERLKTEIQLPTAAAA